MVSNLHLHVYNAETHISVLRNGLKNQKPNQTLYSPKPKDVPKASNSIHTVNSFCLMTWKSGQGQQELIGYNCIYKDTIQSVGYKKNHHTQSCYEEENQP